MSFSKPAVETFSLSPLGAAIVEALPDRKRVKAIQRGFKRSRVCPLSQIFPTAKAVETYYRAHGESVRAGRAAA